jgi:hypothetical protein
MNFKIIKNNKIHILKIFNGKWTIKSKIIPMGIDSLRSLISLIFFLLCVNVSLGQTIIINQQNRFFLLFDFWTRTSILIFVFLFIYLIYG